MPDSTLSQAIQEAYASAPAGVVIFHTLEINHPAFSAPIRVVRDYVDLVATLESSAPSNAGQSVTFTAFNFEITKPEVSASAVPQVSIRIDNVDRSIVANIEAAVGTTELLSCIYREYVSTDLAAPANDPPLHLTIMSITADVFSVSATAGFPDLVNRRFPTLEYSAQTFPGLA